MGDCGSLAISRPRKSDNPAIAKKHENQKDNTNQNNRKFEVPVEINNNSIASEILQGKATKEVSDLF